MRSGVKGVVQGRAQSRVSRLMQSRTRHVRRGISLSLSLTRSTGPAQRLSPPRIARLAHRSAHVHDSPRFAPRFAFQPLRSSRAAPCGPASRSTSSMLRLGPVSCPMSTFAGPLELTSPSYHLGGRE